jgi:hypothetical protein
LSFGGSFLEPPGGGGFGERLARNVYGNVVHGKKGQGTGNRPLRGFSGCCLALLVVLFVN